MGMIESKIIKYFNEAELDISDKQVKQFALFYNLVIKNNSDNDLTRIKGEDQFVIKHFIDSVYCNKFLELPDSIIDIGSGAGFPGIPLKIMNPSIKVILAEQRSRRVEFQKLAVRELGLEGVEFYPHKVTDKSFFNVKCVVTRALEDAPDTLSRVEHFLPEGGLVVFLKGPDASGDIESLTERNMSSYSVELDRSYTLPGLEHPRRLLVFRKRDDSFRKIYKIMKDEKETRGIPVTSEENRFFREMKRLESGTGIKKSGMAVVPGKKIISDYLSGKSSSGCRIVLPDDYEETSGKFDSILTEFNSSGKLYIFRKSLFNELSVTSGKVPMLVIPLPEIEKWDGSLIRGCNPVIPFQDPVNVGSAVRSAAGFGIDRIILTGDAANPYHPKAVRSSSGAVFDIKFFRSPSLHELLEGLTGSGHDVITLHGDGIDIEDLNFPETFILVPGIEGPGLPEKFRKGSVKIPLSDRVESLNASVAVSIFMYEWSRKRN